jgi:signal transduction histidine kinase
MGAAGDVSNEQKGLLGTVKDNVARLTSLVEDVLKISQIDAGRERLRIVDIDLNALVGEVLEGIAAKPNNVEKKMTVVFDPLPDLPPVQADPEKLARIVMNVIDNAFNYTRAGGSIAIEVRPESGAERVLITVQDSGVGIPDDFHERIWRRFERHDDTALALDVAGTGLGLPIVKEMVEMHGGEVWFESVVGEGTTFFITLPFQQPRYTLGLADLASRSN